LDLFKKIIQSFFLSFIGTPPDRSDLPPIDRVYERASFSQDDALFQLIGLQLMTAFNLQLLMRKFPFRDRLKNITEIVVEGTHFMNFLIPLISMNLQSGVTLPNGQSMPMVSCSDMNLCNATPAVMMITVTIVGVATTLGKEILALGPSILMTIPNMFKGMEQTAMISERRDINGPSDKLPEAGKDEMHKIIVAIRPQMLEILETLKPAGEDFAAGLIEAIAEWTEKNDELVANLPDLEAEVGKLKPNALQKRALESGIDKNEVKEMVANGTEDMLPSLIMQKEGMTRGFPRQRVYKRGFMAMEPTVPCSEECHILGTKTNTI